MCDERGMPWDDGELIQRYRFPRAEIEAIEREFTAADFGVKCNRSHAIANEIRVKLQSTLLTNLLMS